MNRTIELSLRLMYPAFLVGFIIAISEDPGISMLLVLCTWVVIESIREAMQEVRRG